MDFHKQKHFSRLPSSKPGTSAMRSTVKAFLIEEIKLNYLFCYSQICLFSYFTFPDCIVNFLHYSPSRMTTISNLSLSMSAADRSYRGDVELILWTIVVGQMKNILSSSPSPPTFSSVWQNGRTSPSLVTYGEIEC